MSPTPSSGTEVQVDVEGRTLTISNLAKVLYPRTGTTKGEVLNYYAQVSPVLLPHLKDRAVTRIRWPLGVEKGSFFEKNAPAGTPSWVRTAEVSTTGSRTGKGDGTIRFPICDDLATLTWLANLAALELHVHSGPSTPKACRATRTASSSTSTPASPRACTSAPGWRSWCATRSPSATWPARR